jgi:hypothetical protein
MDNIIFLDFDGVFILDDIPTRSCIKELNRIVRETNSKIVVTSDWRNHETISELSKLFTEWGIVAEIIGITDNLWPVGGNIAYIERYRIDEINKYLSTHDIKNYVIIDDLELYNSFYTKDNDRFFNTLYYKGITKDIADDIIDFLN